MLVQNLATTYKCYSSIGNSLDLEIMMKEVLKTFVSESYAIYGEYCIPNKNKKYIKLSTFGKIDKFNLNEYNIKKGIETISLEDRKVILISLEYGVICLVSKDLNADYDFFISMFESFINKLNVSINSCLNVEKIKEKNEQLIKQKEELEKANKAKDDFLANMSHELKTPLNSISIISSVMKKNTKNNLTEKQVKNLEIINKCGHDLLFLINDALDMSKLEAGKIELNYEYIDFPAFVNDIYDALLPQAIEKGLDFKLHIDDTISSIYTDENRVKQIIKNLLSNALKFTNDGKINLKIKDEDVNVRIIIEDDGIGIPKSKLNDIFNRFGQVDSTTTRKYGGTGLGLAICKELTFLLKGDITVSSVLNEGTTFEVIIPKNKQLDNSYQYLNLEGDCSELFEEEILVDNIDEYLDEEDIEEDTKDSTLQQTNNNSKQSVLVLNNNPGVFFDLVITLAKKYTVVQTLTIEEFLVSNHNKDYEKAIFDLSKISNHEIVKLNNSKKSNFIVVYNEKNRYKISDELRQKIALELNETELSNILFQI